MAIVKPDEDGVCYVCSTTKLADEALKCRSCQRLVHFECSDLPDYHLVRLLLHRQSTYTCRECIGGEAKYTEMLSKVKTTKEQEANIIKAVASNDEDVIADATDDILDSHSQAALGSSLQQAGQPNNVEGETPTVTRQLPGGIANAGLPSSQHLPGNSGAATNNSNNGNTGATNRICRYYRSRTCKHGPLGKDCPFNHPKKCSKFTKHGEKAGGCKKGIKCEFYHPPLCWSSANFGSCDRKDCKFQHLQGTRQTPRQTPQQPDDMLMGIGAKSTNMGSQPTYAQMAGGAATRRQPLTSAQIPVRPADRQHTLPNENNTQQQDFVERWEMRELREMMRQLIERDRPSQVVPGGCSGRCGEKIWH